MMQKYFMMNIFCRFKTLNYTYIIMKEKDNLKNIVEERLNKKYPEFKSEWEKFVKQVGHSFVNLLKERFMDEYKLFKEISQFEMSIIVDNNFVFGQINGCVENDKKLEDTFLYMIANIKFIKLYAPPKLREELYDKIEKKIKVNNSKAKEYADKILQKIEIKDAFWIDEWKKANNLIGHKDSDDVPYLALAFSLGTHSILSMDKVFQEAGTTQVWTKSDLDTILTNYNKGFISFYVVGATIAIIQFIWNVIIATLKVIADIIIELLQPLILIASGTIKFISEIPSVILLAIIGALIISDDMQSISKDIILNIGKKAKEGLEYISKFIVWIKDFIDQICKAFAPTGITMLELAGYFVLEYHELQLQVANLEKNRAK